MLTVFSRVVPAFWLALDVEVSCFVISAMDIGSVIIVYFDSLVFHVLIHL